MLPKSRLGKRSPLGTLVSALYPAGGTLAGQDTGYTGIAMATGAGQQSTGRGKGHPSPKVSQVTCSCFRSTEEGFDVMDRCFSQSE